MGTTIKECGVAAVYGGCGYSSCSDYSETDGVASEATEAVTPVMHCRGKDLETARRNLMAGNLNTGLTYSDFAGRNTVMVISLTSTPAEFLNSWLHEMRHLSRHIEQAFGISPYGEEAAYLAGDIGQRMFPVAKNFICEHCRKELNI